MITARKRTGIEINPGLCNSNSSFSRPMLDVRLSPISRSFASAAALALSDLASAARILSCAAGSLAACRSALSLAAFAVSVATIFCCALFTVSGYVMVGDTSTSRMPVRVPTIIPSTMPPVLQRFQNNVSSTQGIDRRRHREYQRHQMGDVLALGDDVDGDRDRADDHRRDPRRTHLLLRRDVLFPDDAHVDCVAPTFIAAPMFRKSVST